MMKRFNYLAKRLFILFIVFIFSINSLPLKASAEEIVCNDARLRNLQISIIDCSEEDNCAAPTTSTGGGSLNAGDSVYILGDSITAGTTSVYNAKFAEKQITPVINAYGGRSWVSGGGFGGNPAKDAVQADGAKISSAKAIVIALGSNGGTSFNPVAEMIDAVRSKNPTAPILWVNTAGTNKYPADLSYLGPFNKQLSDNASAKNFRIVDWFKTVNPAGDPFVSPTQDPSGYIPDGLHPGPEGSQKLVDLVVSSVMSSGGSSISSSSESANCQCTSVGAGGIVAGDNTAMIAFAKSQINSVWGVSDATAEQWFLKQAGASRVKNRYGLNEGNIGQITAAVKAAGVSPVFFYAYTVNEGGGAGGFINHYGSEGAGGGVGNATRDANYLAKATQNNSSKPSWVDAGNPVDFVPQSIKDSGNADFQSMPLGTIGRAYIPATAATTWEVYFPNGLKKEFNKVQNYGSPLKDMIKNIVEMGGNPSQSGSDASVVCPPGGVTGEGVTKAVEWAKMIANNDGYGYDQTTRASGWQKWKEDPNCADQCGNFDCSSLIAAAYTEAGYFKTNPQFNTRDMVSYMSKNGFTKVSDSNAVEADLKPGDVLVKTGHTAMYIGDGQIVHASQNERGGATGGQAGDQTGKEILIQKMYSENWDQGIWRASN